MGDAPGWPVILGLKDPGGGDWARVRGAQVNIIAQLALARLAVSVMAGSVIVATLGKTASTMLLMGWFSLVIVVSCVLAFPNFRQRHSTLASATMFELHRETLSLFAAGISWTALPLVLGISEGGQQLLTVWTVATALMGTATFALSAVGWCG
jgi:hypothetical protein